jgi:hypothetical protein
MTVEEERERQLASWLGQTARSMEVERQRRERMEHEKVANKRVLIETYEDIKASLEAREREEAIQRMTKELDAKMQLAQQRLLGEALIRIIDGMNRS